LKSNLIRAAKRPSPPIVVGLSLALPRVPRHCLAIQSSVYRFIHPVRCWRVRQRQRHARKGRTLKGTHRLRRSTCPGLSWRIWRTVIIAHSAVPMLSLNFLECSLCLYATFPEIVDVRRLLHANQFVDISERQKVGHSKVDDKRTQSDHHQRLSPNQHESCQIEFAHLTGSLKPDQYAPPLLAGEAFSFA